MAERSARPVRMLCKQHIISNRISRDVVQLMVDRGMTLTEIGGLIGVSKSFISRVKSGQRSLTLDHLAKFERALGEPIPWLLMKAIPPESVTPELRPLYKATMKLLKPMERRMSRRKKSAA